MRLGFSRTAMVYSLRVLKKSIECLAQRFPQHAGWLNDTQAVSILKALDERQIIFRLVHQCPKIDLGRIFC